MRYVLGLLAVLAVAGTGCVVHRDVRPSNHRDVKPANVAVTIPATIADVKTCGCPLDATCGDCCGPEHCKCRPT